MTAEKASLEASTVEAAPAARRPALLIGYGAFGLDVLRRLLATTAPRGVLRWRATPGGGLTGERSLEDLALLWVPDRWDHAGQQVDEEDLQEGAAVEMMRDLYQQIETVQRNSTPEEDLAAAMSAATQALLSASGRAHSGQESPLGLDVIVLARPTAPEVVGILDRMLARGMEELENNSNLVGLVSGSEALNFIEILDFDNYWDRSEAGGRLRQAVRSSIDRWQSHRKVRRTGFGRAYLVDGRTKDGFREPKHRLDEISLFLEFLLFEGQRGSLQTLYQTSGLKESPLAVFGIRMMERSAGLLSRLAAARFGFSWLEFLAGTEVSSMEGENSREMLDRLEPYRPAHLDALLQGESLRGRLEASFRELELSLLSLTPEDPDWPQRVQRRYEAMDAQLRRDLGEAVGLRMTEISQQHLAKLPADLQSGIDADLHHAQAPLPLGRLIEQGERALEELNQAGEQATEASTPGRDAFAALNAGHARYRRFLEQRVDIEGLKKWWFLLALVLAAGLTPVLSGILADIPKPGDPLAFLLNRAWEGARWLSHPIPCAALLFLLIWVLGGGVLQRRVAARGERARRFFADRQRGRFADLLRRSLSSGGPLAAPLEDHVAMLLQNLRKSVHAEVRRELGRVLKRLRERRREILWLRGQLREFLRMNGLSFEGGTHRLERRDAPGIRYSVEREEDFEQILKANLPGPGRFRSTQSATLPFTGWDQPYGPTFLYPLAFLDGLSKVYRDPFQMELSRPGSGPEQQRRAEEFQEFLDRLGTFDLAFSCKFSTDRRFCMLPSLWRQLPGVLAQLSDLRMGEQNLLEGADVARSYLVRIQTGIEPSALVEAP